MSEQETLEQLAQRAAGGDRAAIDAVVREIQDDVYRLAFRFIGPPDAEDLAQEAVLKVITHLGSFRGESAFRTWVHRIAVNLLLNARRGQREVFSFDVMEAMNAQGVAANLEPPPSADERILTEEVRLACTHAAVLSLEREGRIAFILGAEFGLTSEEAAAVLEIEPAAFRKRFQRARERIIQFMTGNCGIVDGKNACRCRTQIAPAMGAGWLDPAQLVYTIHPVRQPISPDHRQLLRDIEDLKERALVVQRAHPDFAAPPSLVQRLRDLLDSGRFPSLNN